MKVWNDFTKEEVEIPTTPTLESLRQPGKYRVISDAQLKRDLRGRSIADVYRENKAGRGVREKGRDYQTDLAKYEAWCQQRQHVPHPASLDSDHEIARQREGMRYVKRG